MSPATNTRFTGFPPAAVEFYRAIEVDNTKAFWQAHRATYDDACEGPMQALLAELEGEFGTGKLFRPYRDVRFSTDKSPYKTNCSAMIGTAGYLALSADSLYVGGGRHDFHSPALDRFRAAVAAEATGAPLAAIVAALRKRGYEVDGEALKTAPRGYATDHPRADLLRRKALYAGRDLSLGSWLHTREVIARTKKVLHDLRPLTDWLDAHVG
jgi:uncharacterized protein (TIGR02453 family)